MARYTENYLYDVYNAITSGDTEFITGLAKAAISTAVEIQTDMFRESDPGAPAPDDNDIRNHASSFADDMVSDFRQELVKAIKEVKFTGNIKLVQSIESSLRFE